MRAPGAARLIFSYFKVLLSKDLEIFSDKTDLLTLHNVPWSHLKSDIKHELCLMVWHIETA